MQIPNSASLLSGLILNLNTICLKVNNTNGLPGIDKNSRRIQVKTVRASLFYLIKLIHLNSMPLSLLALFNLFFGISRLVAMDHVTGIVNINK
jgi:hypothetical protein